MKTLKFTLLASLLAAQTVWAGDSAITGNEEMHLHLSH